MSELLGATLYDQIVNAPGIALLRSLSEAAGSDPAAPSAMQQQRGAVTGGLDVDSLRAIMAQEGARATPELPGWVTNRRAIQFVGRDGNPKVYFGERKPKIKVASGLDPGSDHRGQSEEVSDDYDIEPKELTLSQAMNRPFVWSDDKIKDAMRRMREAGLNVTTFDQLAETWGALVNRAAMAYSLSGGEKKVTPWDVLDMQKSEASSAGSLINYESGTQTTTQRTVNEITEGQGWQVLQQVLQQALGRDPSDDEVRDFTFRMNQSAARNPSITETIQRYQAGEIVEQDSTTTGGWNTGDVLRTAEAEAQAEPDWAEYQAATTYYNSALGALGAIGSV